MRKEIVIGLIALILISGGVILFQQRDSSQKGDINGNIASPTASDSNTQITPSPTGTKNQAATPTLAQQNWQLYENQEYNFMVQYPSDWEVNQQGQMFRSGDIFNVMKVGPTQTEGTEFFDGARFTVMRPVETELSTREWMLEQYGEISEPSGEEVEYSTETIGSNTFEHAYVCGLGCFDYYHTKQGNTMYGIVTFSAGDNEQTYKNTLQTMLKTFSFTE